LLEKSLTDSSDHDNAGGTPSAMEITWEFLDPVRDSDQPAIIPGLTDYTYHEDDEEDDASIHHDSDTIFVADYQNGHLFNSAPGSAQDPTSQTERVLPPHLNDLLEQWYARHGRTAPNCVCKRSESAMSELCCSKTSRTPVTWLHRSGVPLDVTWYPLPGNEGRSQGNSLKLIVVSGPGVAPCIVTYKNAGGHIAGIKEHGVVYRIWRGLDGDNDGFEFSPSVIKMSRGTGKPKSAGSSSRPDIQVPPPSVGSKRPESTLRCERCTMQHLGCDRQQPICSRCATAGRSCSYPGATILIPEALKVDTTLDGKDLQRSARARKPTTRYTSEELAPALKRKIPNTSFDQDDDEDSNALLSKFMTSSPLISTSSRSFLRASKSNPWVCYLCGDATTNKKDMRTHFRHVHGLNPDESRMKWADLREGTQKVQSFVIVPNVREPPAAARAAGMEAVAGAETTPVTEQAQEEAARQNHDAKLEEHVKNNTKIIFFSRTQTPRVRLFAACDSSHKLFAQATAGGVFSREDARVLGVEVEDQESELPIVEDDAQDFELFVTQLREASCWRLRDGQVEGETVVHVREKRK
jgi:hypothetical protein